MKRTTVLAFAVVVASAWPFAFALAPSTAQANPLGSDDVQSGELFLSAENSAKVPQDVIDITLFYEQEAQDPASLTDALNKRTATALRQAQGTPGVSARTGMFSIYPATDHDGHISAWRSRTELVLESRDFAAASKLAGKMNTTMQVGTVAFSLSPEAQRSATGKLMDDGIASFREQAEAAARAFGYTGFTIKRVSVGKEGPSRPVMATMNAMGANAGGSMPLPVAGGTSLVTVTVSGSVQMTR